MLKNGKLKLSLFVLAAFVLGMVLSAQASKTNKEIEQLSFQSVVKQKQGAVAGVFTTSSVVSFIINNGQKNQEIGFEVKTPQSVLSLLEKAQTDKDLTFTVKKYDFGTMLEELNGLKNGVDGKYWLYYVDGKAATSGVDSLKVSGGDKVEFKFEKI